MSNRRTTEVRQPDPAPHPRPCGGSRGRPDWCARDCDLCYDDLWEATVRGELDPPPQDLYYDDE